MDMGGILMQGMSIACVVQDKGIFDPCKARRLLSLHGIAVLAVRVDRSRAPYLSSTACVNACSGKPLGCEACDVGEDAVGCLVVGVETTP